MESKEQGSISITEIAEAIIQAYQNGFNAGYRSNRYKKRKKVKHKTFVKIIKALRNGR